MGSNPYVNEATSFTAYAGEAITAGQMVAIADADGYAYKADANVATLRPALGIAETTVAAGEEVEIKSHGKVTGQTGLAEGRAVYLSETAGGVTQVPGEYAQVVGWAVTATDYELCICPPLHVFTVQATVTGDIAASDVANYLWSAPVAGMVLDVGIQAANTGADAAADALTMQGDVNIEGTTCMTTLPALTKAAADGSNTFETGTGITAGIVDPAANTFDRGDTLTFDLDLTSTTPEDEFDNVTIIALLGLCCE